MHAALPLAVPVIQCPAPEDVARYRPRSTLERMPKWLVCIPLVLQWLWLSPRYLSLSLTLPDVANPAVTAGGLVGEGKLEFCKSMGPIALAATAAYCAVPTHKRHPRAVLYDIMLRSDLSFPVISGHFQP